MGGLGYANQVSLDAHLVGKAITKYEFERLGLDFNKIRVGEHGKPVHGKLAFNVSHTKNIVVGAFLESESLQVGIDAIEKEGRFSEIIVKKRFSENEQRLVDLDKSNFSKIWVMKEAYLKTVGDGIAFGLDRIDTVTSDGEFLISVDGKVVEDSQFKFIDVNESVDCCVVVKNGKRNVLDKMKIAKKKKKKKKKKKS